MRPSIRGTACLLILSLAAPWSVLANTTDESIASDAITYGRDLDGDGDPDEVRIELEIVEIQQEVFPGERVSFWVFAPRSSGMLSAARAPSPTLRVEEGDLVSITLFNTHYFPHTIHLHGTIHPNAMDGVPFVTQAPVPPGESFTYEFVAKNPGTHFYHCHVQPDVHVLMGMSGMLIIEPNRPDNHLTAVLPGAGRITQMGKATAEQYQREYSLVYADADSRLHRIPAAYADPREIEMRMHRDYDSTQRQPDIFLLNGRSFPFTVRDTPVDVAADERVLLRVLNAGARSLALHTHGHHPTIKAADGYALTREQQVTRDVFDIGPAQRLDLELRTGSDDRYASGPGVWVMHDHNEVATTNKGIGPGGDLTMIIYEDFRRPDGSPATAMALDKFYDPAYYQGGLPLFNPALFNSTVDDYEYGWPEEEPLGGTFDYPRREILPPLPLIDPMSGHNVRADSCKEPAASRTIEVKAGRDFARRGKVFGFSPHVIRVQPCEVIEILFENRDQIRHTFMIPGLNPMASVERVGTGTQRLRFIAPAKDVTLEFHCHLPTHDKMGMHGLFVVGEGGQQHEEQHATAVQKPSSKLHVGVGQLLEVDIRTGRIVIDHQEIPDFMAAMTMSYQVIPADMLNNLAPGAQVKFTIDERKRAIVSLETLH